MEKDKNVARKTTLCYIEKDDCYLMLYRNKKEEDANQGKWIGVGGKVEEGESFEQCVMREVFEETGLTLTEYSFKGIVQFESDVYENESMALYVGHQFTGSLLENCNEGTLKWIPKNQILDLNLWEGDRIFLKDLLENKQSVNMTLVYQGDKLVECVRE